MTKKEIKTVAFNIIATCVKQGNAFVNNDFKDRYLTRAYTIVYMLAELNMLTDEQITNIKKEISEGIYA